MKNSNLLKRLGYIFLVLIVINIRSDICLSANRVSSYGNQHIVLILNNIFSAVEKFVDIILKFALHCCNNVDEEDRQGNQVEEISSK